MYCIQHCFICRPSDSTVSEDAEIEPRTVATSAFAVRRSNNSARSHPHSARYHPHSARSHPHSARSHQLTSLFTIVPRKPISFSLFSHSLVTASFMYLTLINTILSKKPTQFLPLQSFPYSLITIIPNSFLSTYVTSCICERFIYSQDRSTWRTDRGNI
jgi:hypothetical protein